MKSILFISKWSQVLCLTFKIIVFTTFTIQTSVFVTRTAIITHLQSCDIGTRWDRGVKKLKSIEIIFKRASKEVLKLYIKSRSHVDVIFKYRTSRFVLNLCQKLKIKVSLILLFLIPVSIFKASFNVI